MMGKRMSIRKIHKMMVLPSGYGQRGEEVCKKIKPFKIPKNLEFDVAKGEQPLSKRIWCGEGFD